MRLLALTYGTEGDTRPLAMLCHGLIGAGHEVTLLADGATLSSAQALKVPHAALEGDIHDEVVALVSRGNGVAAASSGLARMALQHVSGWMRQADAAAEGCDAILTGGLAAVVGMSVGERRGSRNGSIWVTNGCRAEFVEARGGWGGGNGGGWGGNNGRPGETIRCESQNNRERSCPVGWRNARLVRQLSGSPCDEGRTWGVRNGAVWVSGGCRAEFAEARGWGGGGGRSGGGGASGGW